MKQMDRRMRRQQEREIRKWKRKIRKRELLSVKRMWKQEKAMLKRDEKMQKWKEKRWKRINRRIEKTVSYLVILITVVFSVLEVLEKGERRFTFEKLSLGKFSAQKQIN